MDVRYSPEQEALRDSVARVVADLGPKAVGELDDAARTDKLDAAVADAGWRELRTADDGGAPWASGVEVALIAEELARGPADVPFLGPTLAAELRRLAGLGPADEPETVLLAPGLAAVAIDVEDACAIDAARASHGLLIAGDGLARVALGEPTARVDLTRPVAAPVGTPEPLGGRTLTAHDLDRVVALGLAVCCGDLVGAMQGALDLSTAYVSERQQYGRPVGTFQAVQHLLADALVFTEGSRTLARHAAWAVDALDPGEGVTAGATAKAYAARSARDVGEIAIQTHGGIGNTWECMAHVYLRRSLLATDVFGGVDACLDRVLADRLARAKS